VLELQVEATFLDGCKLVSLHSPICRADGDLALALHGSFLPLPALESILEHPEKGLVPGQVLVERAVQVRINAGREALQQTVLKTADRPVQVGSHYHFTEANPYLRFDRRASSGMRLNMQVSYLYPFLSACSDLSARQSVLLGRPFASSPARARPCSWCELVDIILSTAATASAMSRWAEVTLPSSSTQGSYTCPSLRRFPAGSPPAMSCP
jgi:hypothetical protein